MSLNEKQICCSHIYLKQRPILLVLRTEKYFQFLCGDEHDDEPELIKLNEIIKFDYSIKYILELKRNHLIERKSINDFWTLKYHNED